MVILTKPVLAIIIKPVLSYYKKSALSNSASEVWRETWNAGKKVLSSKRDHISTTEKWDGVENHGSQF